MSPPKIPAKSPSKTTEKTPTNTLTITPPKSLAITPLESADGHNKIIRKRIHLGGNCSYVKKRSTDHFEIRKKGEDTKIKRKKERERREEERKKIDSPVLLSTLSLKLRSKEHLERRLSFLKNNHKYDLQGLNFHMDLEV